MPTEAQIIRSARRRRRPDVAFTLTELLIVMAVIVLALALAVPAIRALTGNKSEQAAQNTLSAFLGQARTEAIGLQKVCGVMFYIDPASDRVVCVQVIDAGNQGAPFDRIMAPIPIYLDLSPNHDPLTLPPGMRIFTVKEKPPTPAPAAPYPGMNARYLGFDAVQLQGSTSAIRVGGVILFDPEGKAISRYYGFHLANGTTAPPEMERLLQFTSQPTTDWPQPTATQIIYKSQLAFVLMATDDLKAAGSSSGTTYSDATDSTAVQSAKEASIDQLATPIFVNRYNGTLTRAE